MVTDSRLRAEYFRQQQELETVEKYWMPVDLYIGGVEHAVLHLLYARFWHKVLFDLGLVSTKEPFKKLVNQGLILGSDGEKMSKSRGNVINPDTVVAEFGADSLRLYEMFMGPLEKVKPWQEAGVKGVYNFLNRSFKFFGDPNFIFVGPEDLEVEKLLHKSIKKVTEDIEDLKFNTCISQLMIFINLCTKKGKVSKDTAKTFALLVSPFAPHVGEELWEILGSKNTLVFEKWPTFDPDLAKDVDGLHQFTAMTQNVDLAGRIVFNEKKEEVFNFGKHKGRSVAEVFEKEPSYYDWMLKGDFPAETKQVLTALRLRGLSSK